MFSLRDLRFVLWSRDLDALRTQRIMGSFFKILITHKSTRSENPITCICRIISTAVSRVAACSVQYETYGSFP